MMANTSATQFHFTTEQTQESNRSQYCSDRLQNRTTRKIEASEPDRRGLLSKAKAKSCRGLLMISGTKTIQKCSSFTLMTDAKDASQNKNGDLRRNSDFDTCSKGSRRGMLSGTRSKGSFCLPKLSENVKNLTQIIGSSNHSETSKTLQESFLSLDDSDADSIYEPSIESDYDDIFKSEEADVRYISFRTAGLEEETPVAQFSCRELDRMLDVV